MTKSIDAQLKTIRTLFESSSTQDSILDLRGAYIIPEYQRAYNWRDTEQCDKLWQDIESFTENTTLDSFFLGSIILNSDNEKLYVIDGQQRITTFILLLKAMLLCINEVLANWSVDEDTELLKSNLQNRRKNILTCLYHVDEDGISQINTGSVKIDDLALKYTNNSINEEYASDVNTIIFGDNFVQISENVSTLPYKKKDNKYSNFYRNFKFFYEKLKNCDSTKLNNLTKKLLNNCQVIVIVSYQTEEAIEIFNSLNSTGMPLADADILSAKLYSNFSHNKSEFTREWKTIISQTNTLNSRGICSLDDILNQYMYILRAKRNEKDISMPGVRRYFTDINQEALAAPKTFIGDFEKIIDIWQDAEFGDSPEYPDNRDMFTLKQVLFSFNKNFRFYYATYFFFNMGASSQEKKAFVSALMKLFALLSISENGYSSSKFKVFLIGLNMQIGKQTPTHELVEQINTHIDKNFSKEEIHAALMEPNLDNGLIYLNEYLYASENQKEIDLNIQKIEIEHIMPKSGKNIIAIREDAGMDKEEFDQNVNKLGNKILLEKSINASVSNNWFRVKKDSSIKDNRGYIDSAFPIAQSLTRYPNNFWKKEDIEKATEKAAQRITEYIFSK